MIKLRFAAVVLVLSVATNLTAQQNKTTSRSKPQSRPLYQAIEQVLDTLSRVEIARENGKRDPAARAQCRAAVAQIRTLEVELADLLRQAYQQKPSSRDKKNWTLRELESLARNLKVQLARAYRNQALCYPAASADRVNALSLALEQLPDVASLPLDEASVWQARLEQIVCLRLLKKHAQAAKLVEHWQSSSPPANIASRLAREKVYLDLEAGNLTHALAHHDAELLNYAAVSLYNSGKLAETVAIYDRIATLESALGHTDQQFQALKTAATIVRETKRPAAALARFRELALQHPRQGETAGVHLVAIGLATKLAREATPEQREEKFEFYATLLKEHLQHWPKSPSAKKVRGWLARTELPEIDRERVQSLVDQGNREQALTLYRKLIANAPHDAKLLEAFAKLLATGKDKTELREALQVWQKIEKRSKPDGPRWWRGRRARLALLDSLGEGGQAKKLRQLTKILHPKKMGEPRP